MTASIDYHRLDLLLLARAELRSTPSRRDFLRACGKFLEQQLTPSQTKTLIDERLETLAADGKLEADSWRPTAAGRHEVTEALGLRRPTKWDTVCNVLVPAQAMGLDPIQASSRTGLRDNKSGRTWAAVLTAQHELEEVSPTPTLTQAIDALACRELGIEYQGPLSMGKIRKALLERAFGQTSKLNVRDLAKAMAASAVDSPSKDLKHVRRALVERWLEGDREVATRGEDRPRPSSTSTRASTPRATLGDVDLESFARDVQAAANAGGVATFGARKAFVASTLDRLRQSSRWSQLGVDLYKQLLIRAHQQDLLRLHRADLVGAMDRAQVDASEIQYMNATFHFIERSEGKSPCP